MIYEVVLVRNLAVIPARSGSKGLKNKNIKLLNNKPLIAYTIEAALKSKLFDEIFVSTDSYEYAKVAKQWGANVPFLRNSELATDTASSWEVVKSAVINYEKIGEKFDIITLLQPTSPLRTKQDILNAFEIFINKNANAVVSVCEVDHSPLWCNELSADNSLSDFLNDSVLNMPRQKLPTYYRINGAIYIVNKDHLMSTDNIYKEKSYASIMSKWNSIDIDSEFDFIFAESILKKGLGLK